MSVTPIRVVTTHPHRHPLARVVRPVALAGGALLYVVGIVAVTGFVAVAFLLASWWFGSDRDPAELPLEPTTLILLLAAAAVLMVGGLRYGRRLVLGHRRTVLYLRRFRDDASMAAVTGAARRSLGDAWRIVSLDDAQLAPVALSGTTTALFTAGRTAARVPRVLALVWQRGMQLAFAAGLVSGFLLYRGGGWEALLAPLDLDAMDGFPLVPQPAAPLGWDAPTVFYASVTLVFLLGQATIVALVVMLGVLALMPLVVAVGSWSDAEKWARAHVRLRADTLEQVDAAASTLAQTRTRVLAPRLVVVTVAAPIWQETVRRLVNRADACLVDVSEPSENVFWELEHLDGAARPWHAIGERPDLDRLARGAADGTDPAATRLAELLGGRRVLAYGTDGPALRAFPRELRLEMECRRPATEA